MVGLQTLVMPVLGGGQPIATSTSRPDQGREARTQHLSAHSAERSLVVSNIQVGGPCNPEPPPPLTWAKLILFSFSNRYIALERSMGKLIFTIFPTPIAVGRKTFTVHVTGCPTEEARFGPR